MKVDTDRVLRSQQPLSDMAAPGWRFAVPMLGLALVSLVVLYWSTAASMAAIWGRSDTFAHGYVIVPISLVLIWLKRHEVAALAPRWDYVGFALLAGAGFAWLVATAGQVQVLQHYAMTAMIPAAAVAVTGRGVARVIAFPLAFLLFAVPAGDGLLPRLMDFTADFSVAALRLSGIPVYREGNFFAIPSGRWSVVEACSGLRYLIASVTVGVLYAYLNYRRFWKRALFVAVSIVVPILANGARAYMIVMIGHLSDMKLAVGVDHFIYGWVFFGVVILLLFWLGSFWRDPQPASQARALFSLPGLRQSPGGFAAAALCVLAVSAAWPLYAAYLDAPSGHAPVEGGVATPPGAAGWTAEAKPLTDWRPHYLGATSSAFQVYRKDERGVALYIAEYRNQRQGSELVNSMNAIAGPPQSAWLSLGESRRAEDAGGAPLELRQTRLRAPGQVLLAWDWYRVSGRDLSNPYLAKALLARDKLLRRGDDAAAIVIAAPYAERAELAQETLRQFVRDMRPSIDAVLAGRAAGQPL
jgi:exosortase A